MNFALEALLMHSWMRHFFMLFLSSSFFVDVWMWKYFANRKLFYLFLLYRLPPPPRLSSSLTHSLTSSLFWYETCTHNNNNTSHIVSSAQKRFAREEKINFVITNMHFLYVHNNTWCLYMYVVVYSNEI